MRFSAVVLAIALLAPVAAHAQDAPPPPPPPPAEAAPPPPPPPPSPPVAAPPPATPATPAAAAPAAPAPLLNWEAGVDAFYQYNFTGDPNSQAPNFRVFDTKSNSFTLNMAKVATYMTADPVGFRIDLIYGNIGAVGNGVSALFSNSAGGGLYTGAIYIAQAYATVKAGIFTLDAGRFYTSASDEVLETHLNWNYSRSMLFGGAPFIHTGLRLGIAVNEMLSLQLAILNGWNNDADNNTNKTFGGQIALTLPSKTTAFLNAYIGNEGVAGKDVMMLYDLVIGQTISDTVALSLNADYWKNGDPSWFGIGLKAKLGIAENFYLVPRVEFISSKNAGYQLDSGFGLTAMGAPTGAADASFYEGTLTGAFPIKKNYEIRAELRGDFSNKDGYFSKGGVSKKNQFTGLVGFLAWLP
jgi:hypothetical protein